MHLVLVTGSYASLTRPTDCPDEPCCQGGKSCSAPRYLLSNQIVPQVITLAVRPASYSFRRSVLRWPTPRVSGRHALHDELAPNGETQLVNEAAATTVAAAAPSCPSTKWPNRSQSFGTRGSRLGYRLSQQVSTSAREAAQGPCYAGSGGAARRPSRALSELGGAPFDKIRRGARRDKVLDDPPALLNRGA
jgi:hypothetical protein